MNNFKLVSLNGFPSISFLSGIYQQIHDISGLKAAMRDIGEIVGLFRQPSTDERFRHYFVHFKSFDVINMIKEYCDDNMTLDCDGHAIKVELPGDSYYKSGLENLPSDIFAIKIIKQSKMSLFKMAQIIEKIISDHNLNTTSSNEVESLVKMNSGAILVTTKSSPLFHALKNGFDQFKFDWKVVKLCPVPKRTSIKKEEERQQIIKRKIDTFEMRRDDKRSKVNTELIVKPKQANQGGMRKLKISDETRKVLQLIASKDYDVYFAKAEDNFESLFE